MSFSELKEGQNEALSNLTTVFSVRIAQSRFRNKNVMGYVKKPSTTIQFNYF